MCYTSICSVLQSGVLCYSFTLIYIYVDGKKLGYVRMLEIAIGNMIYVTIQDNLYPKCWDIQLHIYSQCRLQLALLSSKENVRIRRCCLYEQEHAEEQVYTWISHNEDYLKIYIGTIAHYCYSIVCYMYVITHD